MISGRQFSRTREKGYAESNDGFSDGVTGWAGDGCVRLNPCRHRTTHVVVNQTTKVLANKTTHVV